jgi:hypothetical protein
VVESLRRVIAAVNVAGRRSQAAWSGVEVILTPSHRRFVHRVTNPMMRRG